MQKEWNEYGVKSASFSENILFQKKNIKVILCWLVEFSLPLSDPNKSIPHQKAEGPVRVVSLFRHAGDV